MQGVLPFAQARAAARRLGLRSAREWYAWTKTPARPPGLPVLVARAYRDQGWAGFPDWLGHPPRYDDLARGTTGGRRPPDRLSSSSHPGLGD